MLILRKRREGSKPLGGGSDDQVCLGGVWFRKGEESLKGDTGQILE